MHNKRGVERFAQRHRRQSSELDWRGTGSVLSALMVAFNDIVAFNYYCPFKLYSRFIVIIHFDIVSSRYETVSSKAIQRIMIMTRD